MASMFTRFRTLHVQDVSSTLGAPLMRTLGYLILRNATRRSLDYLDDRMLRDMGLSRNELRQAVSRVRWR